jgi:hypothetical protein
VISRLLLVFVSGLVLATGGCAETRYWPEAPQALAQVAAASRRPVELPEAQKRDVLRALAGSRGGGAKAFSDPELAPEVYASFWRSPIDMQVDRDRLLLVRYFEDGTYVYVGFSRDGRLFTDGIGALLADPPWSQ